MHSPWKMDRQEACSASLRALIEPITCSPSRGLREGCPAAFRAKSSLSQPALMGHPDVQALGQRKDGMWAVVWLPEIQCPHHKPRCPQKHLFLLRGGSVRWPVDPAGLTFSLGVSLFSGFSAIPRKFRIISKIECDREVPPGEIQSGKDHSCPKAVPRPAVEPGRASRSNPTLTPSCHLRVAAQLPAGGHDQHSTKEGCECLLGARDRGIDLTVLLKQSVPEPSSPCPGDLLQK